MGFHDAYVNLRDMGGASVGLIEYLADRAMSRDRKLIITGHSLGGAIATLLAVEMKTDYPQLDIACMTFGAPRVLSQPLAQKVNEMKFYCMRFLNKGDIIWTAPSSSTKSGSNFMHCGKSATYSETTGKAGWLVNSVSDFVSILKLVDLHQHSLAGEKGLQVFI
jgi:putative lipase involved disintegration of autophagic bodies